MPIQYDQLNAAYAALRTLRDEFLNGTISSVELTTQAAVIKDDIRKILGLPPITPA